MTDKEKLQRFVYQTRGICPPEIHFQLRHGLLEDIRFVGGGCTGNAQLVARLLKGRPLEEVLQYLDGIDCRNGTSCPAQLGLALKAAKDGRLAPADSFRIYYDPKPRHKIGLIAGLEGDSQALEILLEKMADAALDAIYCLGNLTGKSLQNKQLVRLICKQEIPAILGETDWQFARGKEAEDLPHLDQKVRDWLIRFPHVVSFGMETKKGLAFFGDYIQKFPGYSDFEPFALEMNMVCGLTNFMREQAVFPALETMIPQFEADIILFSQIKRWGHWHVAGKDFISIGPAAEPEGLSWGLLETDAGEIRFEQMIIDL